MSTQPDIDQLYAQQIKALPLPRAAQLRLLARLADGLLQADADGEKRGDGGQWAGTRWARLAYS